MIWLPITIFCAVVFCIVLGIVIHYHLEKKRTEALAELSRTMGFEFEADGTALLSGGMSCLPVFNRSHSRKVSNVMRKKVRETQVALFDYCYTTGSGKSQHTQRLSMAAFESPSRDVFPGFELRPEHLMHKVGQLFGYQDIDISTHPVFSRRYLLRGPDEPAVRAAFGEQAIDFFQNNPDWNVEARANWMAVFKPRLGLGDIRQFLTDATRVHLIIVPQSDIRGTA